MEKIYNTKFNDINILGRKESRNRKSQKGTTIEEGTKLDKSTQVV